MASTRRLACAAAFAAIACAAAPAPALAAESYDNCAGTIASLPAVITTQGVWCLKSDLSTAMTTGIAVTIAANNVTIDCNGFKLGGLAAGPGSSAIGIYGNGIQNATVRGCGIRGFRSGIYLANGSGHLAEDNRLDGNLETGIALFGSQNMARRNRVYDTGGADSTNYPIGISVAGDAIDNVVEGMFGDDGIVTGIAVHPMGAVARGNRVRGFSGDALRVGINGSGWNNALVDNVVVTFPPAGGIGINASSTEQTFCSGNLVAGFATEIQNCDLVAGNAEH